MKRRKRLADSQNKKRKNNKESESEKDLSSNEEDSISFSSSCEKEDSTSFSSSSSSEEEEKRVTKELFQAIAKNHISTVRNLLKSGADPNKENQKGEKSLIFAIKNGHVQIAKELLKHGARPNQTDHRLPYPSALYIASEKRHVSIVKALLKNGADPNHTSATFIVERYGIQNPLHFSVGQGYSEITKVLLQYGADPNLQTKSGDTPLMIASQFITLRVLLEHGADKNMKNDKGESALFCSLLAASQQGDLKYVQFVLKNGANVNEANIHGTTALMRATDYFAYPEDEEEEEEHERKIAPSEKKQLEVVKFLIENGADPSARNVKNISAYIFAGELKKFETALYLLELGAAENVKEKYIAMYRIKNRMAKIKKNIKIIKRILFPDDVPIIAEIISQYAYGLTYLENYMDKHAKKKKN